MRSTGDVVLSARRLVTTFDTPRGCLRAVDGLDLDLRLGEVVCLVGESGSGKSVTGLSLMGLIEPPGSVTCEELRFDGHDLVALSESEMNHLRGRSIAMIFQEPLSALNPSRRVGDQIAEVLTTHGLASRAEAMRRAVEFLGRVGIDNAPLRARSYPHQLSGGQRQRVTIAIACIASPKLIIADEPTTALDVTIQAQILDLLTEMQTSLGSALLFITHDLGIVAELADRVVVLYAGQVVEEAAVEDLYGNPGHPYTIGLLASVPDVDTPRKRGINLPDIPGTVPNLLDIGMGCRFRERCDRAHERCAAEPPLIALSEGHRVWCWLHAGR
ncbi:MAG: ABC transporter ATP-binding protein [Alphaproteobacteria bacterium]|nr:ABC transporter ATP-binding protein [Alphaproteobacteria bacterium]